MHFSGIITKWEFCISESSSQLNVFYFKCKFRGKFKSSYENAVILQYLGVWVSVGYLF